MITRLLVALSILVLFGCSHSGVRGTQEWAPLSVMKSVSIAEPAELRLGGGERKELVRYISRSRSESFEKDQLRQTQRDETSFTVRSEWKANSSIQQVARTVEKKGNLNLRLLGMPDLNETIEFEFTPRAEVLKAGSYPAETLFFLPPISLPEGPVRVGDTWTMRKQWVSLDDGTPFQLDMISILKGFVACGGEECADIEVSGEITLPTELNAVVSFKNMWAGRVLFARRTGTVTWARTDSIETMIADNVHRRVQSCLESLLVEPAALKPPVVSTPTCDDARVPPLLK